MSMKHLSSRHGKNASRVSPYRSHDKQHRELSSVQVLHVISTHPQRYHSVRVDQRRPVHVLPEKYQFCALGPPNSSDKQFSLFGSCSAKVHYGVCTGFEVFVLNDTSVSGDANQVSSNTRYTYKLKTPPIQPLDITSVTSSSAKTMQSEPLSPTERSIAARIESCRDNIGAAIELLTDDEEPELENLIRNFVREDRRRQGSQQQEPQKHSANVALTADLFDLEQQLLNTVASTGGEYDAKGRKIVIKKSQADLLHKVRQRDGCREQSSTSGATLNGTAEQTPFLSTNREGVVQSRMVRFTNSRGSREASPTPLASPTVTPGDDATTTHTAPNVHHSNDKRVSGEKTVFGISPKSSSLSRYKSLIESRGGTGSTPGSFGIVGEPVHEPGGQKSSSSSSSYQSDSGLSGEDARQATPSVLWASGVDAGLDSSHFPITSSSASWHSCSSPCSSSVAGESVSSASGGSVIDTGKCSHYTGSRQMHQLEHGFTDATTTTTTKSTISASSSAPSSPLHPYLSPKVSQSSPVSTGSATQPQRTATQTGAKTSSESSRFGGSVHTDSCSSTRLSRESTPNSHHSVFTNSDIFQQSHQHQKNSLSSSLLSSSFSKPNTIDTFIEENESFFQSGDKLARSAEVVGDSSEYELDRIDNIQCENDQNMKYQTNKISVLTDDEKALLHETLKVGLYGVTGDPKKRQQMLNGENGHHTDGENCDQSKTAQFKPNRRIILVSKPVPKPEPKPEPKYVNGKVVFGQLPVKPVLQKGSVAERVMLFEKCPEKTSVTKGKLAELQSKSRITQTNRIGHWVKTTEAKPQPTHAKEKEEPRDAKIATSGSTGSSGVSEPEPKSPISSIPIFRRFSRSNSLTGLLPGQLPRFYYPNGRPYSSHEVETQIKKIIGVFERFPSRTVTRKELGGVLKLVGIPVYWKEALFCAVLAGAKNTSTNGTLNGRGSSRSNSVDLTNGKSPLVNGAKREYISCDQFTDYWKKLISTCYDDASRFVRIVTQGQRNYIIPEDLEPLIQDVIDTHPGLLFLKEAEEFHSRYVHTVIARIFYCLDKTWSGTITLPELRKANFLKVIQMLEEEEDINQITDYFSYEHFYVIYCKFWELDTDHDLFISKHDLARHNDSAISSRMIERIFSGAVTRVPRHRDQQMSYAEFVWFLLSEEDKRHPRAIEYWFRCMDLDGDGCLSFYELEYFYSEQVRRMESAGIEALPFTDCLCQMIDLVSPKDPLRITLNDLKRCRLTPIFFDTFFNLEKYLDHEQRDPFASQRDEDGVSMSDWDRYAAEEYELLVAEENAQAGPNHYYPSYQPYAEYPYDDEIEDELSPSESIPEESSEEEMSSESKSAGESAMDSAEESDSLEDESRVYLAPPIQCHPGETEHGPPPNHQVAHQPNHSPLVQHFDDIAKEFYDYLNTEYLPIKEQQIMLADSSHTDPPRPLKLVTRYPLNNDPNNNPMELDDDDFF